MDFLKRSWRQIRLQMDQLSANTKWLIGMCLICLVLTLMLVLRYAGSPQYKPLGGFAADRQGEVARQLRASGIKVKVVDGQLQVEPDRYIDALAALADHDLMAPDTSLAFNELIENSSVWESTPKFKERLRRAKQQYLSQILSRWDAVRSANVIISMPEKIRFSNTFVQPSASVNLVMQGRKSLNSRMVEAIAGLVSGAVAEMKPQDVIVVGDGKQWTVNSEDEVDLEDVMAAIQMQENRFREKLLALLRHIPNVIVTVSVQTDAILGRRDVVRDWSKNSPEETTRTVSEKTVNTADSGEPGLKPNTGAEISRGVANGTLRESEITEATYRPPSLDKEVHTKYAPQTAQKINASIAVPRSHLVNLFAQQPQAPGGEGGEAGEAAAVELDDAFVQAELAKVEGWVKPIIQTAGSEGLLYVDVYDDGPRQQALAAQFAATAGLVGMMQSSWIRPAGLAVLSLMALALMFTMVRKATQNPSLPTAEELAGVPPTLPADDDLIGEAGESEAAMTGLEVDEQDIRFRKIADQIGELVKANPEEAAHLVNKWIQADMQN